MDSTKIRCTLGKLSPQTIVENYFSCLTVVSHFGYFYPKEWNDDNGKNRPDSSKIAQDTRLKPVVRLVFGSQGQLWIYFIKP